MKPFILLPIVIVNSDGKSKEVESRWMPEDTDYYYPGFNDGTVIVLKSGQAILTMLVVEEIDKIIEMFHNMRREKPTEFGFIKIKITNKNKIVKL